MQYNGNIEIDETLDAPAVPRSDKDQRIPQLHKHCIHVPLSFPQG